MKTLRVPGDKSLSHRALMLGALAEGRSRIRGILRSADVQSTAAALRALGVSVSTLSDHTIVDGAGLRGFEASEQPIDCGNSGTTARLLAGILAGHPFASRLEGDASLSRRPMRRVTDPLTAMGARFEFADGGDHLPVIVHGSTLQTIAWNSSAASAQVKSALLLAGLVAGVPVTVREPTLSRDHTERMLRALGVTVETEGTTVSVRPTLSLPPLSLTVPGDPSSAAFLAAAGVLRAAGDLLIEGIDLNPTRTGFYLTLQAMGGNVELTVEREEAGEPTGTVRVRPSMLRGVRVSGADVPAMIDELPLLACIGALAEGDTEVREAQELRLKETDRISAVVSNLRAIGADADELPDGFIVRGGHAPLRGRVTTHGDHRLAMAFGVLGALPGNEIEVDDRACVDVSYPTFWRDLAQATA